MTLEGVLEAAVEQIWRGKKAPHCFRAHVPGQGYVNDGGPAYDNKDYRFQAQRAARQEVENLGWAQGYAEPGYESPRKGVLWGNWNVLPRGFDKVLERLGYAVEWSDEWTTCDACDRALRTQPDGFCWEPSFKEDLRDGTLLCKACWDEEHEGEESEDGDEE